ncbi:MAG: glycosyltransferase family 4 protein [Burkholderiales bacterium]
MLRRIALISDHASPLAAAGGVDSGGQNVYVAQVARHLVALGYRVDVFTRRDSPLPAEVVQCGEGLRIIHVPAGPPEFVRKEDLLPTMQEFAAYVQSFCTRDGPYELIHANFFMSGLVALMLKQKLGIPFVITFHALGRVRRLYQREADQFPAERIDIEDRIVDNADGIIAECPQDEADLLSLYRADPAKISVIPCGFDAAEFWPIAKRFARKTLGLAPDQPLLLSLGRTVPRKGIDNAILSLAWLADKHAMRPTLMVVGGNSDLPDPALTPEIARLRAIAQGENVGEQVKFVGRRSRELLKLYYSAADMFITTPWYEPFGITPLEAMACGTPVIGSDVGGIKYSVVDGQTGYLVSPNRPDALAERIATLYRQPDHLKEFGRNGIRRVNRNFTWGGVTGSIASFYRQVCGETIEPQRRVAALA